MKKKRVLWSGIFIVLITLLLYEKGFAILPEPPNIIYGSVEVNNVPLNSGAVVIKLMGQPDPIASYNMGSIPEAGQNYVLRVPLDVLNPQTPGTARPGDQAMIFVNGHLAANITIGERGAVHAIDLSIVSSDTDGDGIPDEEDNDDDNDGMPDAWENKHGLNPLVDDASEDADNDGYSNYQEYQADTDPNDPNSVPKTKAMPWIPLLLLDN